MTRPIALFRCDATAAIGLGHLIRCQALAEVLVATGWRCQFAVSAASAAAAAAMLGRLDFRVPPAATPAQEPAALAETWPEGCDLLVVDHYERGSAFEAACRPWARRILAIDDLANQRHDCDVMLDQTPGRAESDYASLLPPAAIRLTGGSYLLLRRRFAAARIGVLSRRATVRPVERVLISVGGTDANNLTAAALSAALGADPALSIDVVLGATAPHLASIRTQAATAGNRVRVHISSPTVDALMAEADVAIGAAGMSGWERCCLGLPSIVVTAAKNQEAGAAFLAANGAALRVESTAEAIGGALARLIADAPLRHAMSAAAARLCDGRGSWRVALALLPPEIARDGHRVTLRLAEPDDAMIMYEWQCAPETRRYARRPESPTLSDHLAWLDATIADGDRLLTIICHDGTPAGVLRFDRLDGDRGHEISIAIAPARHGHGIGAAALRLAQNVMPGGALLAEVDPANTGSQRLFRSAGFDRVDGRHLAWRGAARPAAPAGAAFVERISA